MPLEKITIKDIPALRPVLKVQVPIQPGNYEIIKQQMITHPEDTLFTGIYLIKPWGETLYMILCFRQLEKGIQVLDYTEFTNNQDKAEIFYKKMLHKIEYDLTGVRVIDDVKLHSVSVGKRTCIQCGKKVESMMTTVDYVLECPGDGNG